MPMPKRQRRRPTTTPPTDRRPMDAPGHDRSGAQAPSSGSQRLRLLSANIQAGSSTRGYHDYVARSWSHVLPAGNKRGSLDQIAQLAGDYDIVGLNESAPGSLRSGFTNPTHYLAHPRRFDYWKLGRASRWERVGLYTC